MHRYGKEFSSDDVTFNAGVYGVNLDLWREGCIHDDVAYWMNQVKLAMRISFELIVSRIREHIQRHSLTENRCSQHELWEPNLTDMIIAIPFIFLSHKAS